MKSKFSSLYSLHCQEACWKISGSKLSSSTESEIEEIYHEYTRKAGLKWEHMSNKDFECDSRIFKRHFNRSNWAGIKNDIALSFFCVQRIQAYIFSYKLTLGVASLCSTSGVELWIMKSILSEANVCLGLKQFGPFRLFSWSWNLSTCVWCYTFLLCFLTEPEIK